MRNIDNIFKIIEQQDLSVRNIEAATKMANGTLGKSFASEGDLSNENLQKFLSVYNKMLKGWGYTVIENKNPYGTVISKSIVPANMIPDQKGEEDYILKNDIQIKLSDYIGEIISQKVLLADLLKMDIARIKANSDTTVEAVLSASRVQIARTEEIMKALDHLTNQPAGTLAERADRTEQALKSADHLRYKKDEVGK